MIKHLIKPAFKWMAKKISTKTLKKAGFKGLFKGAGFIAGSSLIFRSYRGLSDVSNVIFDSLVFVVYSFTAIGIIYYLTKIYRNLSKASKTNK